MVCFGCTLCTRTVARPTQIVHLRPTAGATQRPSRVRPQRIGTLVGWSGGNPLIRFSGTKKVTKFDFGNVEGLRLYNKLIEPKKAVLVTLKSISCKNHIHHKKLIIIHTKIYIISSKSHFSVP